MRQCQLDLQPAPDEGRPRYPIAEVTAPVTTALLTSLTLPDQAFDPRDHAACAAICTAPTFVLLIDHAGHAYRPYLPQEPCGQPRNEVASALRDLVPTKRTTYTVTVPT